VHAHKVLSGADILPPVSATCPQVQIALPRILLNPCTVPIIYRFYSV